MEKKHFSEALTHFDKTMQRAPDSPTALEAARRGTIIASYETHDFKRALKYEQFLLLKSPSTAERYHAQKRKAQIYFENLQDYETAVGELSKLYAETEDMVEKAMVQIQMARCEFQLGRFPQSESDARNAISSMPPQGSETQELKDTLFSARILLGNILVAEKKFADAAKVYLDLQKQDPVKAAKENVGVSLAISYEEQGDYKSAIAALENLKSGGSTPEYIELRIRKLKERQKNQPGAKGAHK